MLIFLVDCLNTFLSRALATNKFSPGMFRVGILTRHDSQNPTGRNSEERIIQEVVPWYSLTMPCYESHMKACRSHSGWVIL